MIDEPQTGIGIDSEQDKRISNYNKINTLLKEIFPQNKIEIQDLIPKSLCAQEKIKSLNTQKTLSIIGYVSAIILPPLYSINWKIGLITITAMIVAQSVFLYKNIQETRRLKTTYKIQ